LLLHKCVEQTYYSLACLPASCCVSSLAFVSSDRAPFGVLNL
jgi:hypothetical protein